MRLQSRRICLFVDNFSGHNIAYEPTNIRLEWFEPNLTSHIQPLDAGIIHCFKAQYRRMFCHHALELGGKHLQSQPLRGNDDGKKSLG